MAKNVVVCCDGTGNEFGVRNTNVAPLFQIIEKNTDAQVAYYDPGGGTFGAELLGLLKELSGIFTDTQEQ